MKVELRRHALAARKAYAASLTPDARGALEAAFVARLAERIGDAAVIGSYHPMHAEISPMGLIEALPGRLIAYPWFAERDATMMFREGPASEAGPWGIRQPPAHSAPAPPEIVIVPVVAADRRGNRVGHGKGHYDRALSHLREAGRAPRLIGAAWDMQIHDNDFAADSWDVRLDAIATPSAWIECR